MQEGRGLVWVVGCVSAWFFGGGGGDVLVCVCVEVEIWGGSWCAVKLAVTRLADVSTLFWVRARGGGLGILGFEFWVWGGLSLSLGGGVYVGRLVCVCGCMERAVVWKIEGGGGGLVMGLGAGLGVMERKEVGWGGFGTASNGK